MATSAIDTRDSRLRQALLLYSSFSVLVALMVAARYAPIPTDRWDAGVRLLVAAVALSVLATIGCFAAALTGRTALFARLIQLIGGGHIAYGLLAGIVLDGTSNNLRNTPFHIGVGVLLLLQARTAPPARETRRGDA